MPSEVTRSPRADAERNRQRILARAASLLSEVPDASMVQIAEASGVGRATLYRHFASRDEVIDALRTRAFDRAQATISTCLAPAERGERRPGEALVQLITELLALDDPYGLIVDRDPHHHNEAVATFGTTLVQLFEAAQADGALTRDVPPMGIALAFGALMRAADRGLQQHDLSPEEAVDLVHRGLLRGFAA